MLTAEEISTIAANARTKAPAEVCRHVMPLIDHINELEDKIHPDRCHGLSRKTFDEMADWLRRLIEFAGDAPSLDYKEDKTLSWIPIACSEATDAITKAEKELTR